MYMTSQIKLPTNSGSFNVQVTVKIIPQAPEGVRTIAMGFDFFAVKMTIGVDPENSFTVYLT